MTKLDMPKAVFGGLALIAAAIFFGPGSLPAGASSGANYENRYGVQKVQICNEYGTDCANTTRNALDVRRGL